MPVPGCYSNIPLYGCDGTVFSLKSYGAPYTEIPKLFRVFSEKPHEFIQPTVPPTKYNCGGHRSFGDLPDNSSFVLTKSDFL
jgi:hypothetical protein